MTYFDVMWLAKIRSHSMNPSQQVAHPLFVIRRYMILCRIIISHPFFHRKDYILRCYMTMIKPTFLFHIPRLSLAVSLASNISATPTASATSIAFPSTFAKAKAKACCHPQYHESGCIHELGRKWNQAKPHPRTSRQPTMR